MIAILFSSEVFFMKNPQKSFLPAEKENQDYCHKKKQH
jgi:peptide methionine sulfoxide reductase MsrA